MDYFKREDGKILSPSDGVVVRVAGYGGPIMATEVSFEEGIQGPIHHHSHEQISYVIKGTCEFTVGEEVEVLKEGDCVYIPGDIPHGVKAMEETTIIDMFSPQREDFK